MQIGDTVRIRPNAVHQIVRDRYGNRTGTIVEGNEDRDWLVEYTIDGHHFYPAFDTHQLEKV
jgi:hypothetical protein